MLAQSENCIGELRLLRFVLLVWIVSTAQGFLARIGRLRAVIIIWIEICGLGRFDDDIKT